MKLALMKSSLLEYRLMKFRFIKVPTKRIHFINLDITFERLILI